MFIPKGEGVSCNCSYVPIPVGIAFKRNENGNIEATPELFSHRDFLLCCTKCNHCLGNSCERAKQIIFGGRISESKKFRRGK